MHLLRGDREQGVVVTLPRALRHAVGPLAHGRQAEDGPHAHLHITTKALRQAIDVDPGVKQLRAGPPAERDPIDCPGCPGTVTCSAPA